MEGQCMVVPAFSDFQAPNEPYFLSISQAAKLLCVRRETVRLAVKFGDLKMRHLPGRKRPVLTRPDIMVWMTELETVDTSAVRDHSTTL